MCTGTKEHRKGSLETEVVGRVGSDDRNRRGREGRELGLSKENVVNLQLKLTELFSNCPSNM